MTARYEPLRGALATGDRRFAGAERSFVELNKHTKAASHCALSFAGYNLVSDSIVDPTEQDTVPDTAPQDRESKESALDVILVCSAFPDNWERNIRRF